MEKVSKLSQIQLAIKVPKNQRNDFGKYNYRSCEDIVEAAKNIVNPLGFHLIISDEIVNIGNRFYVRATATLTDGTDTYTSVGLAREEDTKKGMDGSQITGAASSYARKYALNGLFAIDDTKDSDHSNTHEKEKKEEQKPALPWLNEGSEQYTNVATYLSEKGTISDVQKKYQLSSTVKAKLDLIITERNKK